MKYNKNIEKIIKNICANKIAKTKTPSELDNRIISDAIEVQEKSKKNNSADLQPNIWRIIMKNNTGKLAATIVIVAVVLAFFTFGKLNTPAWAISETIEAIQNFNAVHIVGSVMDEYGAEKGCELWMRANKSQTSSKDIVIRVTNGVVQWVEEGQTYTYIPQNNTVYRENAITAGVSQWLGPFLFKMLANSKDSQTIHGIDPATGRENVTMLCSFVSSLGPQSYSVRFDVKTKLPIQLIQWSNLERRGTPSFRAWQITYYKDLPDSMFAVDYLKDAQLIEKELTIPESNISLLGNPKYGISTEGLSKEEAVQLVTRQLYQAVIDGNLDEIRKLAPACINWSDEFLRFIINGIIPEQKITEIVEIHPICKEGHTILGSIVAVPVIVKCKNGIMMEEKMIVQFREIAGKSSCVVNGPYGIPQEIE